MDRPFLFSAFGVSGRPLADLDRWLETFCGSNRPEDDIADYLFDAHGIEIEDLTEEVDSADLALKSAVAEIWHEAKESRDRRRTELGLPIMDTMTRNMLVSHDVENYVGVIMRRERKNERRSAFGYRSWWLTLDSTAFKIQSKLKDRLGGRPPASPAISLDFMLHYLAVGPVRARLSRRTEEALPLMMNMSILDAVPQDLLDIADSLRKSLVDLPPNVVNRRIRDALDEARALMGPLNQAGEGVLTEDVKRRIIEQAVRG